MTMTAKLVRRTVLVASATVVAWAGCGGSSTKNNSSFGSDGGGFAERWRRVGGRVRAQPPGE